MDEEFFIDFIDVEYCFRCQKNKIPIFVNTSVLMKHSIGIYDIKLLNKKLTIHSSERSYFKIKNSLLLLNKSSVPKLSALYYVLSAIHNSLLIILFVKDKISYFKSSLKGFSDGLQLLIRKNKGNTNG